MCKQLLDSCAEVSNMLEYKSLKILEDSLQPKLSLPFKDIFPASFFTSVQAASMRDYYTVAYNNLKPCLIRLMQKEGINVNGLALMIRYGFGSDSTYYYKVYEDYIRAIIDNYASKEMFADDPEIFTISEKLRVNYSNLNIANRKQIF